MPLQTPQPQFLPRLLGAAGRVIQSMTKVCTEAAVVMKDLVRKSGAKPRAAGTMLGGTLHAISTGSEVLYPPEERLMVGYHIGPLRLCKHIKKTPMS